jgi:hypothetical protein
MRFVRFVIPLGIVLVGCNGEELPVGPTANYNWAPNCNLVPDIGFVADVSELGDASISDYFWDFGHDGETAMGMAPTHLFPGNDTYEVSITVIDDNDLADTYSESLTLGACLRVLSRTINVAGNLVNGSVEVENVSGYEDAVPSFDMDLLGADGLVRFADLDAGQHLITMGNSVTVNSVQVDCADRCDEVVNLELKVAWNGWQPDD